MNRRTRVIAATGAAFLAAGIAGACSSSSSSSGPTTTNVTFVGTEHLTPAQADSNNFEPTIQLVAAGHAFYDHGSIHLGGGNAAGSTSIVLSKGDVNVHHAATNPNLQPKLVPHTCDYVASQAVKYTVTGGTGAYKDITGGHGVATVTFEITVPTVSSDTGPAKCANPESNVAPTGGKVTFAATGPVTRSS